MEEEEEGGKEEETRPSCACSLVVGQAVYSPYVGGRTYPLFMPFNPEYPPPPPPLPTPTPSLTDDGLGNGYALADPETGVGVVENGENGEKGENAEGVGGHTVGEGREVYSALGTGRTARRTFFLFVWTGGCEEDEDEEGRERGWAGIQLVSGLIALSPPFPPLGLGAHSSSRLTSTPTHLLISSLTFKSETTSEAIEVYSVAQGSKSVSSSRFERPDGFWFWCWSRWFVEE